MQASITNNPNLQNNQQPVENIYNSKEKLSKKPKKYPCTFKNCTKRFTSLGHLKPHILTHKKKTSTCNICNKTLKNTHSLWNHKKIHGDKKFICLPCNIPFISKTHLERHNKSKTHIKKINNINNTEYNCRYCIQILDSKNKLIQHYSKYHSSARPFKCYSCDKTYPHESSMRRHYRKTHENKDNPSKLLDIDNDTLLCIEQVLKEDNIFVRKIDFDENIFFSLEELAKKEEENFFNLETNSNNEDIGALFGDMLPSLKEGAS
jgi:uncharacterized Zn-finger protein